MAGGTGKRGGGQRQVPRTLREWKKIAAANGVDIADLDLVEAKDTGVKVDLFVARSKLGRTIVARMIEAGAASSPAHDHDHDAHEDAEPAPSMPLWQRLRARRGAR